MTKQEIQKCVDEENEKRKEKINEIESLFSSLISKLDKKANIDKLMEEVIRNAKWDFDNKRPVRVPKYLCEDFNEAMMEEYSRLADIFGDIPIGTVINSDTRFDYLLDSEKKHFKGDIIITDPCYIVKEGYYEREVLEPVESDYVLPIDEYNDVVEIPIAEFKKHIKDSKEILFVPINETMCKYSYQRERAIVQYYHDKSSYEKGKTEKSDDWTASGCGEDVSIFGITNYMSRDTIFGDWSCWVYDTQTKQPIGEFCADSGMVCVAELSEWRKYNPAIDCFITEHDWCIAVIKNFEGDIWFEVEDTSFEMKDEKTGQKRIIKDYTVHVVGSGTKDGKPFNFKTGMSGI